MRLLVLRVRLVLKDEQCKYERRTRSVLGQRHRVIVAVPISIIDVIELNTMNCRGSLANSIYLSPADYALRAL
jgi:hypothetical protein